MPRHDGQKLARIVLVDERPLCRDSIPLLLELVRDFAVVGVAEGGDTAVSRVAEHRPDVLLLGLHPPEPSGLAVARRVRAAAPAVGIVALANREEDRYLPEMVRLGARGFLGATATGSEVTGTILAVADGRALFDAQTVAAALADQIEPLTPLERDVLTLLYGGRRNVEIADELSISLKGVEMHLSRVYDKLGVRGRAEAILAAERLGLV